MKQNYIHAYIHTYYSYSKFTKEKTQTTNSVISYKYYTSAIHCIYIASCLLHTISDHCTISEANMS